MKSLNLKILFFLRKEKAKSSIKKFPIYLLITVDKRTEISLNRMVDPEKWDNRRQRVVGSSPEAKATNDFLKSIEVKVHNIQTGIFNRGEVVNVDAIKAQLLGNSEQMKTVLYLFYCLLDQLRKAVGKSYSISTVKIMSSVKITYRIFCGRTLGLLIYSLLR